MDDVAFFTGGAGRCKAKNLHGVAGNPALNSPLPTVQGRACTPAVLGSNGLIWAVLGSDGAVMGYYWAILDSTNLYWIVVSSTRLC